MKCILLVAGFATRLYPLTVHTPKPLLNIGEKTILDHLEAKIGEVEGVDEVILVSNGKFFQKFVDWAGSCSISRKLTVLNDGAMDNDHRLGALADLSFAVRERRIQEDTLVLAGDNLFDFSLKDFTDFFQRWGTDCITAYRLEDPEKLRRTGVISTDTEGRVLEFEEKPANPKGNLAVPPLYLYRSDTLALLSTYLSAGGNPDAPGNFIPWLLKRKIVHAFFFSGNRFDIGTLDSLEEARRMYH